MEKQKKNINFYSQWTDEELRDVIIPLMGRMGLPESPVNDLRWLDKKDSEFLFIAQSLPKDAIESKFQMAVAYYQLQQKNGIKYNRDAFISEIWGNWEDLSKLFTSATDKEEQKVQKHHSTTHEIINNLQPKKENKDTAFSKILEYLYKGKRKIQEDKNILDPHTKAMYTGQANRQNDISETKYDFNKYYGGDGM